MMKKMSVTELSEVINQVLKGTIDFKNPEYTGEVYHTYFIFCWQEIMKNLDLSPEGPNVLEIASGQSDPVPQALEKYSRGSGTYVTANLNKKLTAGMLKKTKNLNIEVKIIEDNARNLEKYYPENSFDLVSFQHAVNDMIQTIAAQNEGIDTINNDWYDILPLMIEKVNNYFRQNRLQQKTGQEFIDQIKVCSHLLKKGGFLVFNTHVFQMDLDSGYIPELYENYINLAREWITESDLPLKEKKLPGFDKQWWLILKK
ncbi:MAG: hypothetical protein ACOC2O_02975 [Bacillota bacterium]